MSRKALLQRLGGLKRWINFWPPFLGAGIRVVHISSDLKAIDVEMPLRFYNANYVGTHFGGSLFAMTDAFYMLMLMEQLGPDYIVWDKAATIRYKTPGRGTVRVEFRLTDQQVADIRAAADSAHKHEPTLLVEVKDANGSVVAEIEKLLYVRKKRAEERQ